MKKLMAILFLTFTFYGAQASVKTETIKYNVGDKEFTGYLAYDDAVKGKRPGVIVLHEWWGHNEYARKRAEMLAGLGYTAFALDMYGSGVLAEHPTDATTFMKAVTGDINIMKERFDAARKVLTDHASVDDRKIATVGYCMGGGISLALARAGEDLDGIAVFHGGLGTKDPAKPGQIKARIAVFTGAEDPFVPADQVEAFKKEMSAAKVDHQVVVYPGAKHSFTVKGSEEKGKKFDKPLAYNQAADEDSWKRLQVFLQETFK